MISYLYTFDYKDEQHPDTEDEDSNSVSTDKKTETTTEEHQTMSDHGEDQPALVSSVRVYAIADKYDIQPLKELAKERFCNWAEDNWDHENFSDIVRELFESTPNSDRGLRDFVIRIVATHADLLSQKDKFRQVIEDFGDLGLGLSCQLLKIHSEEKSGLGSRIEDLTAETAVLNRQLKECERNLSRKSDEINSMKSKVNSLVACRHCKTAFNVEVEGIYWGQTTVQCKSCRTRD
jgi:hypothetical protein